MLTPYVDNVPKWLRRTGMLTLYVNDDAMHSLYQVLMEFKFTEFENIRICIYCNSAKNTSLTCPRFDILPEWEYAVAICKEGEVNGMRFCFVNGLGLSGRRDC